MAEHPGTVDGDVPRTGSRGDGPLAREVAKDAERLGRRLRELRLDSGMSLRELARTLGISPSAVSQIELGTMQPSVNRLIAMVEAIGAPLSAVFDVTGSANTGPDSLHRTGFTLVPAGESNPVVLAGGVVFRRLSPAPTPGLEFFESVYPPGSVGSTQDELLRHEGYEVGNVTAGELTIEFETETVRLGVGDSITFPCEFAHLIRNDSLEPAVATWLIVHPAAVWRA